MRRNAQKLKTTPIWLNKQQIENIQSFYNEAALLTITTGIKYQVDHIIPLRGKNVSGLHVPWNLQVITAKANNIKGNKVIY